MDMAALDRFATARVGCRIVDIDLRVVGRMRGNFSGQSAGIADDFHIAI